MRYRVICIDHNGRSEFVARGGGSVPAQFTKREARKYVEMLRENVGDEFQAVAFVLHVPPKQRIEFPLSEDAVDPHAASTGTPPTRDESSSS